jgi:hypothetical protein
VLAGDSLKTVHAHVNRLAYQRHKVYGLDLRPELHSEAKLATLKFLCRSKTLPPTAVKQKDPGFGRFSRSPFEWCFPFFLNRSVELNTRNLIA